METKTKRNLAIWVIALLVVLNLSSLGTIWFHRYQFKKDKRIEQRDKRFESRRGARSQRSGKMPPFIEKSLNLNQEQKITIDSIWSHFDKQKRTLEDSMHQNRLNMFSIMMEEELDTSKYEELSKIQAVLLRKLNDTMLTMNRSMRGNLSEEQREILVSKFKEMRQKNPQDRRRQMRK